MLFNTLIVILLVLLAGIFAGLTLAMFSIKVTTLERKIHLGNTSAKRIYPLRKRGNQLLCALLIGNVTCYTSMTIFLDNITTSIIAGTTASSLIFVFGEILPQAVFPRFAIGISATFSPLVWLTLIVTYPVSAPAGWLLDKILGKEPPVLWSKKELGEIIKYHKKAGKDRIIDKDEERIVLGALSFSDTIIADIIIPKEEVFYLNEDTVIDDSLLLSIKTKGYSRIPIVDSREKNAKGILHVKNLIGTSSGQIAKDLIDTKLLINVKQTDKLDTLLNLFVKEKIHMAIVTNALGHFVGVATMEDIMEEILRTELEERKA